VDATDPNYLLYIDFNNAEREDAHFYVPNFSIYSLFSVEVASEPDIICSCVSSLAPFLKLTKDNPLNPIIFGSPITFSEGFTLSFWIYVLT